MKKGEIYVKKMFHYRYFFSSIISIALQTTVVLQANTLYDVFIHSYEKIPVLVTGGCGFIGSHLAEKLVALGADVTILDDLSSGSEENIAAIADKITVIHGSITDFDTCIMATKNKQIIFHLAAFISVPGSIENPRLCHEINVLGTQNILEAARINNAKRFVFSSTCALYGESTIDCCETMSTNPVSPYAFSKLIGEMFCKEYAKVFDMEAVTMRYFNVYGPRQNPHSFYAGVIAKFTYNMERNLPLTIFGDGTQTRDYVPVDKVVEANLFLGICNKDRIQGELFNIATGKSISIIELIELLKKQYPLYNDDIIFMPPRPGDIQHIAADCSKYTNLYHEIFHNITN